MHFDTQQQQSKSKYAFGCHHGASIGTIPSTSGGTGPANEFTMALRNEGTGRRTTTLSAFTMALWYDGSSKRRHVAVLCDRYEHVIHPMAARAVPLLNTESTVYENNNNMKQCFRHSPRRMARRYSTSETTLPPWRFTNGGTSHYIRRHKSLHTLQKQGAVEGAIDTLPVPRNRHRHAPRSKPYEAHAFAWIGMHPSTASLYNQFAKHVIQHTGARALPYFASISKQR